MGALLRAVFGNFAPMEKTLIYNIHQIFHIEDQGRSHLRGKDMRHFPLTENAWLLLQGDRIEDFGQGKPPEAKHSIDAQQGSVLPSYVDSHSHLVYAGTREDEFALKLQGYNYQEIAARGGGIINSARKLRSSSEEELYQQAARRLEELISLGTGALEIKSGYGLDLESELKMLRVARRLNDNYPVTIRNTFLGAHAIPPEYAQKRQAYLDLIIQEMLPAIAQEGLADFLDVFCEEGYFSLDETKQLLRAAEDYQLPAKLHLNQFTSMGAVPEAVNAGALSVDHLEVMEESDLKALSGASTVATLLPGCSFYLGIPYAPGRELIDRNATVALATDYNPGSAPSGNMNFMLSLACIKMKMTPEEALTAATLHGARALQLETLLGSIERGKKAHFAITKPHTSAAFLPYNFGHNQLREVWLDGICQYRRES